ncbi:class I SAM-dependent methyltransferase [Paenibacillus sp. JJ-223]|uniref:class I SAM-dependent methyltransferase n=1 Tax=Paenibacillus sp. JJ-223 TaxID=2905647 RepID=UPI001F3574D5|nr:class I SAM-dependent methyltransferase [Paenibacillus sp. JJ-223]CAH1215810.1 hypothetical protein PAECIP111890_04294 [Paenibacillus sp. JJ-223]
MLKALKAIQTWKSGDLSVAGQSPSWLQLLLAAERPNINLERVRAIAELETNNPVLDYVERTLQVLDGLHVSFWVREIVEEVLAWSETAKAGTLQQRRMWLSEGINLFVHNIGSAQLYVRYAAAPNAGSAVLRENEDGGTYAGVPGDSTIRGTSGTSDQHEQGDDVPALSPRQEMVRTLIATHGLIGQYIRGEIPFAENLPVRRMFAAGWVDKDELRTLLLALNECVIAGVDPQLWQDVQSEVRRIVGWIIEEPERHEWTLKERLSRLRSASVKQGEPLDEAYARLEKSLDVEMELAPLADRTLWYVEAALQHFSFNEMVQIFRLALKDLEMHEPDGGRTAGRVRHISFEPLMNTMYYDHKGAKKLNVYKKRMIEKYLEQWSWEQMASGEAIDYPHLTHRVQRYEDVPDTAFVTFEFSPAAEKLIAFCIEAEKSPLYERAVLMLFDLFGLRRDAYDRFHNEEAYLADMNGSGDYKKVLLDYIAGRRVLDIGPGGGVLLDLIEQEKPDVEPIGIDISANVIEALERKKQREGRRWQVMKGDALQLDQYVQPGTVDTVIFSSILHELYSYIEHEGRRFNPNTVATALRSAFDVLTPGGRILIRDGIMTEPETQKRRIRFMEPDGMQWLERYAADFQGRSIAFDRISDNEAVLNVNDAMEFLYTYTWGPDAYVHEIQEQFGIFTPSAYERCIKETLGDQADIILLKHFLQKGYTEALSDRIVFMDEEGMPASLPDSTCLIVIEKKERAES